MSTIPVPVTESERDRAIAQAREDVEREAHDLKWWQGEFEELPGPMDWMRLAEFLRRAWRYHLFYASIYELARSYVEARVEERERQYLAELEGNDDA